MSNSSKGQTYFLPIKRQLVAHRPPHNTPEKKEEEGHLTLIITPATSVCASIMMTATFLCAGLIVCVLNALPTASWPHRASIAFSRAGAGLSPKPHHFDHCGQPRSAVPKLYQELAVDVARPSNGTHGWTAVAVSYDGNEDIGTVIDRGLAAHGINPRDALVSVRLDEEVRS